MADLNKHDLNTIQLIDVRNSEERKVISLGGMHIPLEKRRYISTKLNTDKTTIVYCESGTRSAYAVEILSELGFYKSFSLEGGITSWKKHKNL